jgi:hypothetical protein
MFLDSEGLLVLHELFGTRHSFRSGAVAFPIQFSIRPTDVKMIHSGKGLLLHGLVPMLLGEAHSFGVSRVSNVVASGKDPSRTLCAL